MSGAGIGGDDGCEVQARSGWEGAGRGAQSFAGAYAHVLHKDTKCCNSQAADGGNGWAQMRRPRRPEAAPVGAVGRAAQPQAGQRTGRRVGV
eukprot:scaffold6587_cov103-Isochrysis_galbana.AAC.12